MNTSELMVDGRHFVRWEHGWAEQIAHSRKPVRAKFSRVLFEIARLTDALKAEQDACDAIRSVLNPDVIGCVPGSAPMVALDWCRDHDARRAAQGGGA